MAPICLPPALYGRTSISESTFVVIKNIDSFPSGQFLVFGGFLIKNTGGTISYVKSSSSSLNSSFSMLLLSVQCLFKLPGIFLGVRLPSLKRVADMIPIDQEDRSCQQQDKSGMSLLDQAW